VLNKEQGVEECDATKLHSGTSVGS